MIKAVVFDLDDTLFPEVEYVKSGFRAIAKQYNDEGLYERLYDLFKQDSCNVYQRIGFSNEECRKCIEIYRHHKPDIKLESETYAFIEYLKDKGYKLGIITDGRIEGQKNKIEALGLNHLMDCIIVTDELGGVNYRKPNPKSFEIMKETLSVEFEEMMYIGDNPQKDFYIGAIYPIITVRIVNDSIYDAEEYHKGVKEKYMIKDLKDIKNILNGR